jgi:hypothetical protein
MTAQKGKDLLLKVDSNGAKSFSTLRQPIPLGCDYFSAGTGKARMSAAASGYLAAS